MIPSGIKILFVAVVLSLLIGGKIGYDLANGKCGLEKLAAEKTARRHEQAVIAKAQEISRGYQADLAAIRLERDRLRDKRARVVRVCSDSSMSSTASGRSATAAPSTEPASAAGFDIGQPLYDLVDDADEREQALRRQLIACQEFHAR